MRTFILGSQVRGWIRGLHRVRVRSAMLFALREDGTLHMQISTTTDAALARLILAVGATLDEMLQKQFLFSEGITGETSEDVAAREKRPPWEL